MVRNGPAVIGRIVLCSALLAVLATGVLVGGATATQGNGDRSVSPSITVEVDAAGNANWKVTNVLNLSTESERSAFDDLAANESQRQELLNGTMRQYRGAAAGAMESLDRSMSVNSGSVELERTNSTGVVTYRFQWRNFARHDGDAVVVGDVFAGGFPIGPNRTLTVVGPSGYRLASHNVTRDNATFTNGSVTWQGPVTVPSTIALTYENITPTPTASPTESEGSGFGTIVGVVGLLLSSLWMIVRRPAL